MAQLSTKRNPAFGAGFFKRFYSVILNVHEAGVYFLKDLAHTSSILADHPILTVVPVANAPEGANIAGRIVDAVNS